MFGRIILASALLLLTSGASGADNLYGPVLGIFADGSSGLRSIRGIPGAATISNEIPLGSETVSIAVAPRRNSAVVATTSDIRFVSLQPDGSLVSSAIAPGVSGGVVVGFSPNGSAAALYQAGDTRIHLAGSSQITVDASALPDGIALLSASEQNGVVAGLLANNRQAVFVLDGQGGYRLIGGFRQVTDLTFIGTSRDLAISDSGRRQIFLVRDPISGSAPQVVLDLSLQSLTPVHIASSADGSLLAVLAKGSDPAQPHAQTPIMPGRTRAQANTAGLLRLSDGNWSSFECNCAATVLSPLSGNAVFGLTQRTDQPLWILDGDSEARGLFFVPAVQQ